jgi:hypothetical protein
MLRQRILLLRSLEVPTGLIGESPDENSGVLDHVNEGKKSRCGNHFEELFVRAASSQLRIPLYPTPQVLFVVSTPWPSSFPPALAVPGGRLGGNS